MSKKVFITGINGFIGKYLKDRLLNERYEVYGLVQELSADNIAESLEKENIHYYIGDLLDYKTIYNWLDEISPHFIIHLAARTEVEGSFYDPSSFSEVNYVGTVNLVEASRQLLDKNLELFVFSSTMETYGKVPKHLWTAFTEETPQFPNAPYAVAKLACEYYIKYASETYGLPYTILRQSNAYGRTDNDFFVVEQFITQMLRNKNEVNFGYREPYRNFIYIEDLIDLYSKILNNVDLSKNEIFVTGPDNVIQISALAALIARKIGYYGKINWGRKRERPGEIYFLNSNPEKAWRVLRWKPETSLDIGLDKTISIWRKNLGIL